MVTPINGHGDVSGVTNSTLKKCQKAARRKRTRLPIFQYVLISLYKLSLKKTANIRW